MIVYLKYIGSTAILTFPLDLGLSILRNLFQLIFLIGVVAAFYIHPLSASTRASKTSERMPGEKVSVVGLSQIPVYFMRSRFPLRGAITRETLTTISPL
jgi:hypothetical protein